jgi:hypothetical protein
MSIKRHAWIKRYAGIKLYAGIVAAVVTIGGLGMAGAAPASLAIAAPAPVAHCNVIEADGYSPCLPRLVNPGGPINPGGPMKPLSA